jgi:hypothetical protein
LVIAKFQKKTEGVRMRKRAFIPLLVVVLLCLAISPSYGQPVTYSEAFTQGATYCPGSSQYDNWITFRSNLDTGIHNFGSVTVSGTFDQAGISCSNPAIVLQIADALHNASDGSWSCDGHTWNVSSGCYTGCASAADAVVLHVDDVYCSCTDPSYVVRPGIGNENWGGVNSDTCYAPTQTMTVTFAGASQVSHSVPTMTEWGMLVFAALAGLSAMYFMSRRRIAR